MCGFAVPATSGFEHEGNEIQRRYPLVLNESAHV